MVLKIDEKLLAELQQICNKKDTNIKFSVLIGTKDVQKNDVMIFSAVHFPRQKEDNDSFLLNDDELNQLEALGIMLPYLVEILGIVYYCEEGITENTMKCLAENLQESNQITILITVNHKDINYYFISQESIVKIKAETYSQTKLNLLTFIETIEFEIDIDILDDQSELKKQVLSNLDVFRDKIEFNKNQLETIDQLQKNKSPLDRIIEISIPCELKKLGNKTEKGKLFLAYDLHINIYPKESILNNKLIEIKDLIHNAFQQDLVVKIQRAYFDNRLKRFVVPSKVPLRLFGLQLNAYTSPKLQSNYEYQLCDSLYLHSKIKAELDEKMEARIFLHDLIEYYKLIKDEDKIKEITKTILALS
ncbi:MAG: hypothetical protein FK734_15885 [Asgard group archaeon]|nr:hypothetical protein [Asgard group archaeon]